MFTITTIAWVSPTIFCLERNPEETGKKLLGVLSPLLCFSPSGIKDQNPKGWANIFECWINVGHQTLVLGKKNLGNHLAVGQKYRVSKTALLLKGKIDQNLWSCLGLSFLTHSQIKPFKKACKKKKKKTWETIFVPFGTFLQSFHSSAPAKAQVIGQSILAISPLPQSSRQAGDKETENHPAATLTRNTHLKSYSYFFW